MALKTNNTQGAPTADWHRFDYIFESCLLYFPFMIVVLLLWSDNFNCCLAKRGKIF